MKTLYQARPFLMALLRGRHIVAGCATRVDVSDF
jgi:hypothetical protein